MIQTLFLDCNFITLVAIGLLAIFFYSFKGFLTSLNRKRWYILAIVVDWKLFVGLASIPIIRIIANCDWCSINVKYVNLLNAFILLFILIWLISKVKRMWYFDKESEKDTYNNILQVLILLSIIAFIISVIIIFDIDKDDFLPFAIISTILGWVSQDFIRGAVAYLNLRYNNLLHIGDLIYLPGQNVDGFVEDVTLTTVTVRSLDMTRSNVSIFLLQNGVFRNNREIQQGRTDGRRMLRSFLIDMNSISIMKKEQYDFVIDKLKSLGEDTTAIEQNRENSLNLSNLHLFRIYLHHWLAVNNNISRRSMLLVRLLEATSEGIPLQVSAFIMTSKLELFEKNQFEIIEHILLSVKWFGLRIYQKSVNED